MPEVQIRTFRNFDPPHLVRLWNTAYQSRGVAAPISPDIFDIAVLAVPFFDPAGLIVAEINDELVGFAHVGFCVNEAHTALDHSQAVLCTIVVDPDHRHEDIGTRLLEQARNYARGKGAEVLFAGPSPERDPFYNGIYGGSRPSGFLESQPSLIEFLTASGFEPVEQHGVFQKDLTTTREPINLKLVAIRRRMELQLGEDHRIEDWWWAARLGRYELLRFDLVPRNQLQAVASITVLGLDFFVSNWNHRAVGMLDLIVAEEERRKGYGQSLLIEVGRRLKDEMITLLEIHAPLQQAEMVKLITGAGFTQVDTGVVFRQDL
ncbi:GNAT family N-acetyltransferase [Rubinisphaera margarita]|uniref:GNAT family N-acetyltransferase n=1 Tax=Rubinisphaera margarita TaxID=2909586 RepID=UPI001EE94578|nr:GNAT family N-acetyltransferase [Rubinisphaera margarita]MCG6157813.1 GNAT family N-acetyltransferase [Rubinisphaera margarita]